MFEADGTAGGPSAQPSRVRVARRGRRRLLRDPALRLGVAAGALWIIGFAAAAYALHGSHHDTRVLRDGAGLAPIALACALSIAAVARTQGRQRAFWTLRPGHFDVRVVDDQGRGDLRSMDVQLVPVER